MTAPLNSFSSLPPSVQKEKLIHLIQVLQRLHTKPMKATYYITLTKFLPYPSFEEVIQLFGSWNNFLNESGIVKVSIKPEKKAIPCSSKEKSISIRNKLSIEESLHLCSKKIGPSFTVRQYAELRKKHPSMMSASNITHHYGSWKQALTYHEYFSGDAQSKTNCLKALQSACLDLNTCNLTITQYRKWLRDNVGPSVAMIKLRFGNWKNALASLSG